MPGQGAPGRAPRAGRGVRSCLADQQSADPANEAQGGGERPRRSPLAGVKDEPPGGCPALIATLARGSLFTLARWQTWGATATSAGSSWSAGTLLRCPSWPHGMPVAKTYGYDGQFFYRAGA